MDILILLGLIGLSAVISTAEIGFFSVNETRLKALAQNGSKRAAKALQLRSDPQKLLSTILVGDRLVGTAIPMFATFITLNAYGGKSVFEEAIAIMVGILTFVLLVSVDVIPKTLAAKFAVPVTLRMAYPIYWVQLFLQPLLFVIVPLIHKLTGGKGLTLPLVTEEELKIMLDQGGKAGELESEEVKMIKNVLSPRWSCATAGRWAATRGRTSPSTPRRAAAPSTSTRPSSGSSWGACSAASTPSAPRCTRGTGSPWRRTARARAQVDYLLAGGFVPEDLAGRFRELTGTFIEEAAPFFRGAEMIAIHGDCHISNIIYRPGESFFLIDFDDMSVGPPVQDFWIPPRVPRRLPRGDRHLPRTVETGKLHDETVALIGRIEQRYGLAVEVYRPKNEQVVHFVKSNGEEAMYRSIELRKACCGLRKLELLSRMLGDRSAWVTGLRREQSDARGEVPFSDQDDAGRLKLNAIADWTWGDVWHYIATNDVPYNPLHDQFMPSIGCAPCTRAIAVGEPFRAGRWWWEDEAAKDCGLHVSQAA